MTNKISIREIENAIKQSMTGSEIQFSDSVYEKKGGQLRLIIFFNKLFTSNNVVLYTKLLFEVDNNKEYLEPNKSGQHFFKYLYDINCQYKMKMIENVNDFREQWSKIIKENDFGTNIKILSEFIKQPSFLVNEWFNKNNIKNISLTGFKYDPKAKIMPCRILSFHFELNVNNSEEIELFIKKEDKNDFIYSFLINGRKTDIEKSDLSTLVQTIGETLKENYFIKESQVSFNPNKLWSDLGDTHETRLSNYKKFISENISTGKYIKFTGNIKATFDEYRNMDDKFIEGTIEDWKIDSAGAVYVKINEVWYTIFINHDVRIYDEKPVRIYNENDPYGEEDWGDEYFEEFNFFKKKCSSG